MNTNALTTAGNNADFFKTLAGYRGMPERPKPIYLRFDGKNGSFNETSFNETEGKSEKRPWKAGTTFDAPILLVRWFAKEKYKEGATVSRRTREFNSFNDEVTLLEINWQDKENGTKEVGTFDSYADFKDAINVEYGSAVNLAIMEKKPVPQQKDYAYDLWASVYLLDLETSRIVNLKLKGLSRKAVFDYFKSWKRDIGNDSVVDMSQVLTRFSTVEFTDPMHYFAAKLVPSRVLEEGEQAKVKEAVIELFKWMQSFEKEESVEVKTEEIPF